MALPRVLIVCPAVEADNNGNWRTAARWRELLKPVASVEISREWLGQPADALIALHARRSAAAVARWHAARGPASLALVLTGTDVYRDIGENDEARHSLQCASQLVVLQPDALDRLTEQERRRARVILQSARAPGRRAAAPAGAPLTLVAAGHLRDEKDPQTLMEAAALLGDAPPLRIVHLGAALDPALGIAASNAMRNVAHYQWLGAQPPGPARRWIGRADALVHMSRMEGGAQVVIEAVRSGVPVLASRIGGNVGLLGDSYDGFFPVGDAQALAAAMRRFADDPLWRARLRRQCAERAPAFAPALERGAVRRLLRDLIAPHNGRDTRTLP